MTGAASDQRVFDRDLTLPVLRDDLSTFGHLSEPFSKIREEDLLFPDGQTVVHLDRIAALVPLRAIDGQEQFCTLGLSAR